MGVGRYPMRSAATTSTSWMHPAAAVAKLRPLPPAPEHLPSAVLHCRLETTVYSGSFREPRHHLHCGKSRRRWVSRRTIAKYGTRHSGPGGPEAPADNTEVHSPLSHMHGPPPQHHLPTRMRTAASDARTTTAAAPPGGIEAQRCFF
ncbi:hypothetical protein MSAN_00403900 [Mycena sanguinolenta]|uniref:Uncharacterized protein n=1 Tax=Mycena sanguinolenta TaxID=230812 RepID=A0A8H6ZA72_9AGAR|nr:hypothetical protein MSAN_00403900 [Mycena sanguinolenta]